MSEQVWTPEEQKAHRKLWVEALRSGQYRQATNALSPDGGFCCLGVACDISDLGEWRGEYYSTPEDESYTVLPTPVRDWLGLRDDAGFFETGSLTTLNDAGSSFAEIAAVIESEPQGLIAKVEAA